MSKLYLFTVFGPNNYREVWKAKNWRVLLVQDHRILDQFFPGEK